MSDTVKIENAVRDIRAMAVQASGAEIVTLKNTAKVPGIPDEMPVAIIHEEDGANIISLARVMHEYASHPAQSRLCERMTDKQSFIEFVKRFRTRQMVLTVHLGKLDAAEITAHFDYQESSDDGGTPGFDRSSGQYTMDYTPAAWDWLQSNERVFTQSGFADFLQDRICDVVSLQSVPDNVRDFVNRMMLQPATPAELMSLSKGLSLTVRRKVNNQVNLDSGEREIQYEETHTGKGNDRLVVPNVFLLGIQLFNGDEMVYLPVRLSYRVDGADVKWSYRIIRAVDTVIGIKRAVANEIAKEVNAPVYFC